MTRRFEQHGHFQQTLSSENFGGYFEVTIWCDVTAVITVPDILGANGDYGRIDVTLSNMGKSVNPFPGELGGGFWNVGGLTFPDCGEPSYVHDIGTDPSYDNWPQALDDCFHYAGQFGASSIFFIGSPDDNPGATQEWWGATQWGRSLSSSDWSNGTLNSIKVLDVVARYYDGDPQYYSDTHHAGAYYSDGMGIDWDYIPWAIKRTNWMSHNRSGGNFQIKNSGSWRTIKNNLINSNADHAWQKVNGSWKKSPVIGNQ